MARAIGGALPLAVGIALSPIPVIAVVLILTSRRARVNGPAFIVGWLAGLGVVGAIVLAFTGSSGAGRSGAPSWLSWLELVLGVLLLLVAAQQFRRRPRSGDAPAMPAWMTTIDGTTPATALGLAAVLAGANPKNLILAAGGAAIIARSGIAVSGQAIAYLVFAGIGTISVAVPVAMYFIMGKRSERLLLRLKDWMARYAAAIMAVLCLVIAARLLGDAISGLAS